MTVTLHFVSIALRGVQLGACPLGTPWERLSLVALAISITYLVVELRIHERSTGVFVLCVPFVMQLLVSIFMLSSPTLSGQELGVWRSLKGLAEIIGFSAVLVSGIYALLYLFLYTAIKRGCFGLFFQRMPDLETLSRQNFAAAVVACVAITVTLAVQLGGGGSEPALTVNGTVVIIVLTWLVFGGISVARLARRLGAKRLAYTTVVGVVLAAVLIVVA